MRTGCTTRTYRMLYVNYISIELKKMNNIEDMNNIISLTIYILKYIYIFSICNMNMHIYAHISSKQIENSHYFQIHMKYLQN